ncbi:MAG TPA: 4-alpha-glucanotransferase [Pseudolabrys sp.]|nr:4-alpha-glucanotransferase [Pseudolabrys sp.]
MRHMTDDELAAAAQLWGIEAGYHDIFGQWHTPSRETLTRLIAAVSGGRDHPPHVDIAPLLAGTRRAFQGDGRRIWSLAVQLYAVRSHRNWGHGDFGDLLGLVRLAAASGAGGIGLNPLHALFPDRADQASPYAPNSRLYLNLLYIDVEAVLEFPGVTQAGFEEEVAALRARELIAYRDVARVKLAGLRLAYDGFRVGVAAERRADFEAFREEQGEALLRFACFEALRQKYAPKPWMEWPAPWRSPDRAQLEDFRRAHHDLCEFHEFVQWVADRQLQACKDEANRLGMPIGLYVDLAVGINPDGADAWSRQDAIMAGVSVGAPPDEFNRAGQDWGLAPFNPFTVADHDFAPMRQLMAAAMRHAGAIRIDHVLGLKRMFMIPHGSAATDGAYVRFPFEPLLRVIAEESHRFQCVVIGEDLGTVPEGFRDTLACWGLWTYRVMLFEREGDGRFRPPEWYPVEALATFNTHDLPSFRGWMEAHDLRVKRGIGVDPGESDEARSWAQQMLRTVLGERAAPHPPHTIAAVAAFLGATPTRLVVIALEDILGEIDQINIPATIDEHPNWQRRLAVPLEDLDGNAELGRVAEAFTKAGRNFRS